MPCEQYRDCRVCIYYIQQATVGSACRLDSCIQYTSDIVSKYNKRGGDIQMIVKIAPLGERVVEVNVEQGTTIVQALSIAGVLDNGRSIKLNNVDADLDTGIATDASVITLAQKMKGGM